LPERSTVGNDTTFTRMHDQIEQMLASGLARSRHSSADLSVMIMPAWEERSAPGNSALVDNSLACEVVGLRLWESQDKADDGHITPCRCFVGEFFSKMSWPISVHSSARLSGSGKYRNRRKGHTSPTYRGAVRLDNNREAFR